MTTLDEFLARGIPLTETFLTLEAGTPAFTQKGVEIATVNEDFEEATTPGGKPEWWAMSSLMQLAMAYGRDPTPARREVVAEALAKAKACVRVEEK